jgi:regulator of protease activity HflC (stomatin/prohibitin superfamily)
VDVLHGIYFTHDPQKAQAEAEAIRTALEARGLEIKEIPPPEGDGGQQRIAGGEAKDNTKQGQSK